MKIDIEKIMDLYLTAMIYLGMLAISYLLLLLLGLEGATLFWTGLILWLIQVAIVILYWHTHPKGR